MMEAGKIMINSVQTVTNKGTSHYATVEVVDSNREIVCHAEIDFELFAKTLLRGSEVPCLFRD